MATSNLFATPPLLLLPAAGLLAGLAYWLYSRVVVPREVRRNVADIKANGSLDSLRRAYHARRVLARLGPWLGCSVVPTLPLLVQAVQEHHKSAGGAGAWWAAALAFAAVAVLLGGYFARFFTPQLNVARGLPEFRASGESASWPDAAAWRSVRAIEGLHPADQQEYADWLLARLLTRAWVAARWLAGLLGVGIILCYLFGI